jgi:L-aspartate oxidase
MQTLIDAARKTPSIRFISGWRAQDLRLKDGRVAAVILANNGQRSSLACKAVVLATGGIGQLFACTTNPSAACGEGLAMAARAGAKLADLEFVQFHPTALDIGRDPMPLLTEALRGDGAILLNSEGERFMQKEHELAELAPRDVVARAIWRQLQAGRRPVLDARDCFSEKLKDKFPLIREVCLQAGLDPAHEPLPVAPAAHYHMGGVVVDEVGRSTVPGLWACGEVSCAFIHGANRLASNSLLEALVYSQTIANDLRSSAGGQPELVEEGRVEHALAPEAESEARLILRRLMYDRMGLVRDAHGMTEALRHFADLALKVGNHSRLASHTLVAAMMTYCALERKESRGSHSRLDYTQSSPMPVHTEITYDTFVTGVAGYLHGAAWLQDRAA